MVLYGLGSKSTDRDPQMGAVCPVALPHLHGAKNFGPLQEILVVCPDVRGMIKAPRDSPGYCINQTGVNM